MRRVARRIWRADGVRGFYRGLGPGVLRVMPQSAIVFMAYERILRLFEERRWRAEARER